MVLAGQPSWFYFRFLNQQSTTFLIFLLGAPFPEFLMAVTLICDINLSFFILSLELKRTVCISGSLAFAARLELSAKHLRGSCVPNAGHEALRPCSSTGQLSKPIKCVHLSALSGESNMLILAGKYY